MDLKLVFIFIAIALAFTAMPRNLKSYYLKSELVEYLKGRNLKNGLLIAAKEDKRIELVKTLIQTGFLLTGLICFGILTLPLALNVEKNYQLVVSILATVLLMLTQFGLTYLAITTDSDNNRIRNLGILEKTVQQEQQDGDVNDGNR